MRDRFKIGAFVLALLLAATACRKETTDPVTSGESHAEMSVWKSDAIGAIHNAATNSVAYNRPDANGTYKIFISDLNGSNEVAFTYPSWPADRHQWAEEWDPTGQYLFCYVEKTDYAPEAAHTRVPADAIPGYGAYTDLWVIRRDGSQAWQLTDLPNDYDHGVIHGAISQDGTKFAWTERVEAPHFLDPNLATGAYVFKVADVSYSPEPTLANVQTYQPGGVLAGGEVESISPDKTDILVYSTFESQNILNTPLYRIDLATGATTQLTSESFAQSPTYTPDGLRIVYMTGKDCDIFPGQLQGADWWIMDRNGANKKRLTYMNKIGDPQSANAYRLAGSLSFVNDTTFLGGIMTTSFGLTGYTALVTFQ